jgi:hypothetical protein
VNTFAHLEHLKCLTNPDALFDIGVLGVPFDTAVSYRPGLQIYPFLTAEFILTLFRSEIWTKSNSCSVLATNFIPIIQSPSWNQSIHVMGEDSGLW